MHDADLVTPVFEEFHSIVNGDDIDTLTEINGIVFTGVELLCAQHRAENADCVIAIKDSVCVGYLLGHYFANSVLFVRQLFVYPEFEGYNLGARLVRSTGKPVRMLIFQTRKERPPGMIKLVSSRMRRGKARMIAESDKMVTWQMDWR